MMELAQGQPGGGLLEIREGARRILESAGALHDGWSVRGIRRLDARAVVLDVGPPSGQGVALEWCEPAGEPVQAFLEGDAYAVGYRRAPGNWDLDDAETPSEIKRAAAAMCHALAHASRALRLRTEEAPSEAGEEVALQAEPFGVWLARRLAVGDAVWEGWRLAEIYPHGIAELAVAFEHPEDTLAPRLKVRLRDDERPAAFRTPSLDITYNLVFGQTTDDRRAAVNERLAAEFGLVLESLDRGVHFVAPETGREFAELADAPPPAMNLAIPAPCGQTCNFCSVREEIYPVLDRDSALVRSFREDIVRAARRGTRVLRINGIEPLNAPYLFELLELARDEGIGEFHLLSTCRPLADRDFAARYVAAMPARYHIYVPLYGSTAEIHDAVSGTEGSFDDVMRAIANLRELMGEGGVLIISTILVRQNHHDAVAMRDLVKPLCDWWEVHLAFPNTSSKTDRYRDVSISMSEALDAAYPDGWWPVADIPLGEVLPCIALRHQERTGHELLRPDRIDRRVREQAGTFYRSAGFEHSLGKKFAVAFTAATVPCPHRDGCALAGICPGQVYALYADLYGMGELEPITRERIGALYQGDHILHAIDTAR
ncbi:MAG: radical SAM protein [Deltaproteobacteria bacterium]|nr:radical SAM protein [Deltaproteobacteria bacterium]MCB9785875.1 radical SAM protein [Deltaproteobacteria bacterium]